MRVAPSIYTKNCVMRLRVGEHRFTQLLIPTHGQNTRGERWTFTPTKSLVYGLLYTRVYYKLRGLPHELDR